MSHLHWVSAMCCPQIWPYIGSGPKQQQMGRPGSEKMLSPTEFCGWGDFRGFINSSGGPVGLECMDGDPDPLSPAKTPWTYDSFAVSGKKLSSRTTEKMVTRKLSWVEVTHMTENCFCLCVPLIEKTRLSNILFQKWSEKRKPCELCKWPFLGF